MLHIKQAAKELGITRRALRFRIKSGTVEATKMPTPWGGHYFVLSQKQLEKAKANKPATGRPRTRLARS